jgi:hypothetical protein
LNLEIKLIGAISQVLDTISQFRGLNAYLNNNLGYVSHAQAILHQKKVTGFVAEINSEDTKKALSTENFFEYAH